MSLIFLDQHSLEIKNVKNPNLSSKYLLSHLDLAFLPIKITLKQFLEGFLERLLVNLTKNPSRNCFNVILITKKPRLM